MRQRSLSNVEFFPEKGGEIDLDEINPSNFSNVYLEFIAVPSHGSAQRPSIEKRRRHQHPRKGNIFPQFLCKPQPPGSS